MCAERLSKAVSGSSSASEGMEGDGEVEGGVIGFGEGLVALAFRTAFGRRRGLSEVRFSGSESDSDVGWLLLCRVSEGDDEVPGTGLRVMPVGLV